MPIRFHCSSCGAILAIAHRKAGKNILCPKCDHSMIVPGASTIPDPDDTEHAIHGAKAGEAVEMRTKGSSTKVKPKAEKKPQIDDRPLFERPDIESLLEPKVKTNPVANFPVPASPKALPAPPPAPKPIHNNSVVFSKGQLTGLVIGVVVLLALAVTVGFLLGR